MGNVAGPFASGDERQDSCDFARTPARSLAGVVRRCLKSTLTPPTNAKYPVTPAAAVGHRGDPRPMGAPQVDLLENKSTPPPWDVGSDV